MPAQPKISPELAATIKATMPATVSNSATATTGADTPQPKATLVEFQAKVNATPNATAAEANMFAKLQAMIPSAKGVISGSDMLVQAPTFILRVPVSRTEAFNELHIAADETVSGTVDVSTEAPTTE